MQSASFDATTISVQTIRENAYYESARLTLCPAQGPLALRYVNLEPHGASTGRI